MNADMHMGVNARPLELTILMPCLNEAETLGQCILKAERFLDEQGISGEIIIADTRLFTRIEPTLTIREGEEIPLFLDPDHCFVLSK